MGSGMSPSSHASFRAGARKVGTAPLAQLIFFVGRTLESPQVAAAVEDIQQRLRADMINQVEARAIARSCSVSRRPSARVLPWV